MAFSGNINLTVGSGIGLTYGNSIASVDFNKNSGYMYFDNTYSDNNVLEDDVLTMTMFEFMNWDIPEEEFISHIQKDDVLIISADRNKEGKIVSFRNAAKAHKKELYEKYKLLID